MVYGDYLVFVDESGDHGLVSIDPDYPVFVLDFCIVRKDHYANFVTPKLQEFKFTHFGHDLVILHEHDIRKKKPPFKFLENRKKTGIFMEDLSRLIDEADFTIIAAVIDKRQHAATYKRPINPYDLALRLCMERTYLFLKRKALGTPRARRRPGTTTPIPYAKIGYRRWLHMRVTLSWLGHARLLFALVASKARTAQLASTT